MKRSWWKEDQLFTKTIPQFSLMIRAGQKQSLEILDGWDAPKIDHPMDVGRMKKQF